LLPNLVVGFCWSILAIKHLWAPTIPKPFSRITAKPKKFSHVAIKIPLAKLTSYGSILRYLTIQKDWMTEELNVYASGRLACVVSFLSWKDSTLQIHLKQSFVISWIYWRRAYRYASS